MLIDSIKHFTAAALLAGMVALGSRCSVPHQEQAAKTETGAQEYRQQLQETQDSDYQKGQSNVAKGILIGERYDPDYPGANTSYYLLTSLNNGNKQGQRIEFYGRDAVLAERALDEGDEVEIKLHSDSTPYTFGNLWNGDFVKIRGFSPNIAIALHHNLRETVYIDDEYDLSGTIRNVSNSLYEIYGKGSYPFDYCFIESVDGSESEVRIYETNSPINNLKEWDKVVFRVSGVNRVRNGASDLDIPALYHCQPEDLMQINDKPASEVLEERQTK